MDLLEMLFVMEIMNEEENNVDYDDYKIEEQNLIQNNLCFE